MAKNNIEVKILGDAKGFNDAVDDVDAKLSKVGGGIGKIAGAIATAGAAATVAIGAGLAYSIGQASDLNESLNAVSVTFGDAAAGIMKLGEDAATSVGLSNTEFNGLAVQFSSFAKTIAGPGGDVVSTMDEMTTRAADFASVMNLEVGEAAAMFQSGLAGETEPLKKFGLDLSAAAVEAYAAANGIGTLGEDLTEAEKVTARYGLLMQDTASAQGDFANTSDGLANQQRILKAQMANVAAKVGTALLPILAKLATFVGEKLVPWFEENLPKAIDFLIETFGGLVDTVKDLAEKFLPMIVDGFKSVVDFLSEHESVLIALGVTIGTVLVGATLAWVAALVAQAAAFIVAYAPIAAIALAIGAFVAGVIYAYQNFETFRNIVDAVVTWLRDVAWPAIQAVAIGIAEAFGALVEWVREHWEQIKAGVQGGIDGVKAVIDVVVTAITKAWEIFGDTIIQYVEDTWTFIQTTVQAAIDIVRGIIDTVIALITGDWEAAWNGIKDTLKGVWDLIAGVVQFGIDQVEAILTGAWEGIKAAAAVIWDGLLGAADAAWQGIVDGVTALPGLLLDAVGALADAGLAIGEAIVGGVIDGFESLASGATDVAKKFANGIIGFVNSNIIGKVNNLLELHIDVPFGPDIDIDPPNIPNIPTFHAGGIVPGSMGADVPILAQAGEMVLTRSQQQALLGGGGGITIGTLQTSRPGETVEELRRVQWLEEAA